MTSLKNTVGTAIKSRRTQWVLQLSHEEHKLANKLSVPDLPSKARVVFKFGSQGDGYWNNELFIEQVKTTIRIAEF